MQEVAPVVIVGAGASGGVAALRLAEAGIGVVCLEQGDWPDRSSFRGAEPDGELVARKQWSGLPHLRENPADYPIDLTDSERGFLNYNGVGGGTVLFAAQWPRMLPDDFRVRSVDGEARDWPIGYEELAPCYEEVDRQFGVSGLGGNPAYPPGADPPLPPLPIGEGGLRVARTHARLGWHWWPETNAIASAPYAGRHPCVQRGTCQSGCGEGAKASTDLTHWPAAVAAGARLVTGARARDVAVDRRGRACGVTWIDPDGGEHFQPADVVLLACNGVGTARLLLNSTSSQFPDGLANSSGLVGRRLMLHPLAVVSGIFPDDLGSWHGQMGGLIQSLQFYRSDPKRGFVRGARWGLTPGGGPLRTAMLARNWGPAHHRSFRERFGRTVNWGLVCEDLPEDANFVRLSGTLVDSSGIPAPEVHYRIGENTRALMRWHTDRCAESLSEAGAIRTELHLPQANGHLLGTACMGDDPATSVVDRWGFAHDVPNLGIVDGSVFVTSGGVNPTATIAALALRTADRLVTLRGRLPAPVSSPPPPARPAPAGDRVRLSSPRPGAGPESRGRARGLGPSERKRLDALARQLVPGDADMPGAGDVDLSGTLLDRVLAARPDLLEHLRRALGSDDPDPSTLRRDDREGYEALLVTVAGAYYLAPEVWARIGYPGPVPHAVHALEFPAYLEEGLLEPVLAAASLTADHRPEGRDGLDDEPIGRLRGGSPP